VGVVERVPLRDELTMGVAEQDELIQAELAPERFDIGRGVGQLVPGGIGGGRGELATARVEEDDGNKGAEAGQIEEVPAVRTGTARMGETQPLTEPVNSHPYNAEDTSYFASARLFALTSTSSCKILCAFSGSSNMRL
jgi:hypothetical protein